MSQDTTRRALQTSAGKRLLSRVNITGLLVMAGLVALWDLYSRTFGAQLQTIPSVAKIAGALGDLAVNGPLLPQLAHTVIVSLVGWIVACALGLTLGVLIGVWRPVWAYSMATVDVLRSIPSISLVSIVVMIFGFSSKMEMVIVVYVSQWPVLLAAVSGVSGTPKSYLDSARALRLSSAATIFKIRLPAALPSILVGMRLALTLSLSLAVVAEMIGNPAGLGFGLVYSQQAIQAAQAFAYLVVIGVLGWGLNVSFVLAARRLFTAYAIAP